MATIHVKHLRAFTEPPRGRESNDELNKLREEFLVLLLSTKPQDRSDLRLSSPDPSSFKKIEIEIDRAVASLQDIEPAIKGATFFKIERKGGRTNNYDFVLSYRTGSKDTKVNVELKRGRSIFDQPQFLSLYVNAPDVVTQATQNYAEFFFDTFFEELQKLTGCSSITKSEYLRGVYGTSYETSPFNQLYQFVKLNKSNRSALSEIQHRSIDLYLKNLVSKHGLINLDSLQERLFAQLDKVFLSWDTISHKFYWERFSGESLTLSHKVFTKSSPSGQISTIVIPTATGQRIEMLLRWKNNPCVKGPAWQIRLTSL